MKKTKLLIILTLLLASCNSIREKEALNNLLIEVENSCDSESAVCNNNDTFFKVSRCEKHWNQCMDKLDAR